MNWDELDFWKTGEWQVVEERLNDLDKKGVLWCPGKANLFAAFKTVRFDSVRCVIVGQDPYPDPSHATGVAFSVPSTLKKEKYPPTLVNIFKEFDSDLRYPFPPSGNLNRWGSSGVLLWNATPSCEAFKPRSHRWPEWDCLTREVITRLDSRDIVFVFLGGDARRYAPLVTRSNVIETSHPSPRGAEHGFFGSRIFSTVNGFLCDQGLDPINWRLDNAGHAPTENHVQSSGKTGKAQGTKQGS